MSLIPSGVRVILVDQTKRKLKIPSSCCQIKKLTLACSRGGCSRSGCCCNLFANLRNESSLSSLGSTAELLQQLAGASGGNGGSSSLSNMKRKLLDVDGAVDSQGANKR